MPDTSCTLQSFRVCSTRLNTGVPSMTVGATDAHQYEQICDTCLRCSPFMAEPEEAASGVHGTNERILVRAYLQGIRVLIDLMEHANL